MDDDDLLQSAADGDEVSLDQLLERHLPQLRAYVHKRLNPELRARESGSDIVQSVCRDVLAQRGRFDFRGEESFRAWLFTAALNKIRMKFRKHHAAGRNVQREVDGNAVLDMALAGTAGSPTRGASLAERAAIVHAALATLSEDHREVITLARVVGLPHKVVAEVMDRSEDATRQLLSRALLEFTAELARLGVDS